MGFGYRVSGIGYDVMRFYEAPRLVASHNGAHQLSISLSRRCPPDIIQRLTREERFGTFNDHGHAVN